MASNAFCRLLAVVAFVAAGAAAQTPPVVDFEETLTQARTVLDEWSGNREDLDLARALLARLPSNHPGQDRALKEQARWQIMTGLRQARTDTYRGRRYQRGEYVPGTLEMAEDLVRQALAINPRFAEGYVLLGHVQTEMAQFDEAAAALAKAEELGTRDPWLHLNWAVLHKIRGEDALSEGRWRRVIGDPAASEKARNSAYDLLIAQLRSQGQHEAGVAASREQIAASPHNAWVRGNFASYLESLGRYDEAIAAARDALRIMDYGVGRYTLGVSLYRKWAELVVQGKAAEAEPLFSEARQFMPDLVTLAVKHGPYARSENLMRALVEQRKIPVDTRDTDGSTLLLIAVNTNREPVVRFLLALGANPNVSDPKGWTPLISAADEGNAENVRILLAAGADRAATRQGRTAEAQADFKGHREIARAIREHVPGKG